jgi:polyhydroxyalkanoate synthase
MTAPPCRDDAFFARQWLGLLTPANWLPTNPVVLKDALESGGATWCRACATGWHDVSACPTRQQAEAARFEVGRDVAVTPGQVVLRNRLDRADPLRPADAQVHPEPLLIVPSWIMKYYILDLSPHELAGALPGRRRATRSTCCPGATPAPRTAS